ncbi:MAG: hypothetical protein HZA46_04160 [Planctomycetales bacterium]|nr:hypothetical protein [Planctomycetales bacterium]
MSHSTLRTPQLHCAVTLTVAFTSLLTTLGCDKGTGLSGSTGYAAPPAAADRTPAETSSSTTIASARISTAVAHAPTASLDYFSARDSAAKDESRLTKLPYSRRVGERGFGKVLTTGLVPRKILASHPKAYVCDEDGSPVQPLRDGLPYFVFDEREGRFFVGQLQDVDLAQGWVQLDDCYPWFNRRLCYPKRAGEVSLTLASPSGDYVELSGTLPSFDPTSSMPWPVLATADDDKSLVVLADLRPLGGGQAIPIRFQDAADLELYVLFSQREIDEALQNLTRLAGILPKLPVGDIPRVFGSFLTQNQVDFVDLGELQTTLDAFPGKAPDFLMKRELGERLKHVEHALGKQVEQLLRVAESTDHFNAAHYTYVVPLNHLH